MSRTARAKKYIGKKIVANHWNPDLIGTVIVVGLFERRQVLYASGSPKLDKLLAFHVKLDNGNETYIKVNCRERYKIVG